MFCKMVRYFTSLHVTSLLLCSVDSHSPTLIPRFLDPRYYVFTEVCSSCFSKCGVFFSSLLIWLSVQSSLLCDREFDTFLQDKVILITFSMKRKIINHSFFWLSSQKILLLVSLLYRVSYLLCLSNFVFFSTNLYEYYSLSVYFRRDRV